MAREIVAMIDVVDAATRSRMMSGIKSKNTGPELLVRRALHRAGLRYRLHNKGLPGAPDLTFAGRRAAIFIHGCFWHRHRSCRYATMPATRPDFWRAKFEANLARDERAAAELHALGWRVATVWECALRDRPAAVFEQLQLWVNDGSDDIEIGMSITEG